MTKSGLLGNFKWNEINLPRYDPIRDGLVAIYVIDNKVPRMIGTAFIVSAEGSQAFAISAAHCFEEVRKVVKPHKTHHLTALREFLPSESKVDFSSVKALFLNGNTVFECQIESAIWDSDSDLAVLKILAPQEAPDFFRAIFYLDTSVPKLGEEVVMIGYGDMKVESNVETPDMVRISFRPIVRVGYIENIYSNGYFMLKSPCIETSIAICGGMSGGLVARWSKGAGQIRPFAFISHAPEPQPFMDRSQSGQSVAAVLTMQLTLIKGKGQIFSMRVNNIGCGEVKEDVLFPFVLDE